MEPTESGLYCESCAKNIVDFRGKSVEEISKIRTENPRISCGVFDSEAASADSRTSVQNIFRIAFAAIFVLGFNVTTLFGQSLDASYTSVKYTEVVAQNASIMGAVINHHGKPLAAKVAYKIKGGETISFETLKDGLFEFELPALHLGKQVYISIMAEGFYTKYLSIDNLTSKCHIFEAQLSKAKKPKRRNRHVSGMIAGKF
jgi:hypothetical protein